MSPRLRVLVLSLYDDLDGGLDAAGAQLVAHRCSDLADMLGRAAAGAADAVLLSPRAAGVDAAVVGQLRSLGCRVLALVGGAADVELGHRIGIEESVAMPLDARALLALLRTDPPAEPPGDAPPGPDRPIIAVWGPPGSPGRSTAAALLALGAQRSGCRVAVVDADLAAPQWSLLAPGPAAGSGLIVAARRVAAGSADVSDLLVELAPGVSLLSFAAQPDRWIEVLPSLVAPVLHAVAECVDVVVVDLSADIRAAHPAYDIGWAHDGAALARAALAAATGTVAVLSAEPLGVHRFASWWPLLRSQADPALIVANRVGMPRGGPRPEAQIATVLQAMGARAAVQRVAWDPKAADGLLTASWSAARGWSDTPERLWRALSQAAAAGASAPGAALG